MLIFVILTGFEKLQVGTCRPRLLFICVQLELLYGFFRLHTQKRKMKIRMGTFFFFFFFNLALSRRYVAVIISIISIQNFR